ncbi:MAG TPA: ornithine carbamoyltransferase [Gemmatimonadota bacterium]
MKKDFLSAADLDAGEYRRLFTLARELREKPGRADLAGRTLALIFEKPSLRTRVTFEAGMTQLGGHAIYLAPADIGLGRRESVPDVARNLERWVDAIAARTFAHATVVELAAHSRIPVVNALSDREHPCQSAADFLTVLDRRGSLEGLRFAYLGDGNNVCHSLLLMAALFGVDFRVAGPAGYEPAADVVAEAERLAAPGFTLGVTRDPVVAARGAHVLYTDVWASMGSEDEAEARRAVFTPYQLNAALVRAADPDVLVMHCLPAHRGEEITDEILDGPRSVVFDQAENRLHAQKALLLLLLQHVLRPAPRRRRIIV